MHAIGAATGVLNLFELPSDEVPPEHIWHHEERLSEWFAAVKQNREDRMNGLESVPDADGDDEHSITNQLAKSLRSA